MTATLKNAVNTAFFKAGDLVKIGTLSDRSVSSYDFLTGETKGTEQTLEVEVILFTKTLPSGAGFSVDGMMKSGFNVDAYDTLTVEGVVYNITKIEDDDFSINLSLAKEK
jgi:hypothetical protein